MLIDPHIAPHVPGSNCVIEGSLLLHAPIVATLLMRTDYLPAVVIAMRLPLIDKSLLPT